MSTLPTATEVVHAARKAAAALAEIHAAGRVHGAISPGAFSADGELMDTDGARDYSAPEVILGKEPTAASDVFSFGAMFFTLLTGRHPFEAPALPVRLLKICSEAPLDLQALRRDLPGELVAVIGRCLQRDPAQRFASAAALRDALSSVPRNVDALQLLVADDDPSVGELVRNVAARLGFEAEVVASGKEAVAALKARRFAMLLLDLHMPRIDGWQVLDFLRANPAAKPPLIYVITGVRGQQISEADRSIVDAVMYKPLDMGEMRELIARPLVA